MTLPWDRAFGSKVRLNEVTLLESWSVRTGVLLRVSRCSFFLLREDTENASIFKPRTEPLSELALPNHDQGLLSSSTGRKLMFYILNYQSAKFCYSSPSRLKQWDTVLAWTALLIVSYPIYLITSPCPRALQSSQGAWPTCVMQPISFPLLVLEEDTGPSPFHTSFAPGSQGD